MTKPRTQAVAAVLGTAPWTAIALALVIGPLIGFFSDTIGIILALIGSIWVVIWGIRNLKRWAKMLYLAATGTPPRMLETAAVILETWPTLVAANSWVSRTALGLEPSLPAKAWGLITGNHAALGPQVARVEEAPAGCAVYVNLTPVCGAERIAAATESIADLWGAQSVEVSRPKPGVARLLVRTRDPLAGTQSYMPPSATQFDLPKPPSADDFLKGMGE